MELSVALAEHIARTGYGDVPRDATAAAKRSLLDARRLATEGSATCGNPRAPISGEDLLAKFHACVAQAADPEEGLRWTNAADTVLRLDRVEDVAMALAA